MLQEQHKVFEPYVARATAKDPYAMAQDLLLFPNEVAIKEGTYVAGRRSGRTLTHKLLPSVDGKSSYLDESFSRCVAT